MKIFAAIFLALILVLSPTAASYAAAAPQLCIATELIDGEPVCVKTGVKAADDPTIDVPKVPGVTIPPIPRPSIPQLPTINVPSVPGTGGGGSGGGSGGGNGGSGGSGGNGGSKAIKPGTDAPTLPKGAVEDKEGKTPTVRPNSEPAVVDDGVEGDPTIIYRLKDWPWYAWVSVLVAGLGIGFMLFFDTDKPKKDRGRHSK